MKIPGLSRSTGQPPPLPDVYTDKKPSGFGRVLEGEDQLNELWESGRIEELYTLPEPKVQTAGSQKVSFREAVGRAPSKFEHFHKAKQPTIFGPARLFSNVLELRSKYT